MVQGPCPPTAETRCEFIRSGRDKEQVGLGCITCKDTFGCHQSVTLRERGAPVRTVSPIRSRQGQVRLLFTTCTHRGAGGADKFVRCGEELCLLIRISVEACSSNR